MKNILKNTNFIFKLLGIVSLLTALFSICYIVYNNAIKEGLTNHNYVCSDVLVKDGSKFYLYNSKKINVPGVNPVEFNNLEEYVEFLEWQKSQNINCPVLYLQKEYDIQGEENFRKRPSPTNLQGGLPEERINKLSKRAPENNKDNKSVDQEELYFEDGYSPNHQCHTLIKKTQVVQESD